MSESRCFVTLGDYLKHWQQDALEAVGLIPVVSLAGPERRLQTHDRRVRIRDRRWPMSAERRYRLTDRRRTP